MPLCDCMSSKKAKYQFSCRVVHVHDYCVSVRFHETVQNRAAEVQIRERTGPGGRRGYLPACSQQSGFEERLALGLRPSWRALLRVRQHRVEPRRHKLTGRHTGRKLVPIVALPLSHGGHVDIRTRGNTVSKECGC